MRQRRVSVVFFALAAGLALVELRLVRLQVAEHDLWARESLHSTMRFESLPFERGWILDRSGEPLALTREVRDLSFRFRSWRKTSTVGRLFLARWLLEGQRRPVAEAFDHFEETLDLIGALSCEDLFELAPRQRRLDLLFYLKGLLAPDDLAELGRARQPEKGRLAELPGFQEGRQQLAQRARTETQALARLARLVDQPVSRLRDGMDAAIVRADRRVEARMGDVADEPGRFARARQLHAELDGDAFELDAGVPYDTQTFLAVRSRDLPGFEVRTQRRRSYPAPVADVAPLIVGRVGQPREDDIQRMMDDRVRLADLAAIETLTAEELDEYEQLRIRVREIDYAHTDERGILGVESALESVLRGKRGWIASAAGDPASGPTVESVPPQRGLNVTLTLDLALQIAAEELLDRVLQEKGWAGSVVLLDPRSGQVRALATSPRPRRRDLALAYSELLADPLRPLAQRALDPGWSGNLPPPGSTFKPAVALAGLATGAIDPQELLSCEHRMTVGTQTLGCLGWHGPIPMTRALAKSCNIYFYRLADRIGGEALLDMARRLGYGRPARLLLGNEVLDSVGIHAASGLHESWVPLPDRRLARVETMRLAIGQAPLDDVTPLQVAGMMGALAVGYYRQPSLVASVEGYGALPPRAAQDLLVSRADLDAVRAGLAAVVDRGTATEATMLLDAELAGLTVSGKTGTPEVAGQPDHSWFAGWLPRDDPALAFAVFLEHTGEHGGEVAVPVFRDLLDHPGLRLYLRQEGLL